MTPSSPDVIGWWIGAIELVFGLLALLSLLQVPDGRKQPIAAVFAWMMISGSSRLLRGRVPDEVLITVELLTFSAAVFWYVRAYRARRALTRELRKRRSQPQL
jgi:hypothetical protein